MRHATDFRQHGVTLIEMIVAIVVTGVLVTMASMFGRWQIQSYLDVSSRAGLADAADTALHRMTRELHSALPNSVRVSGNYLEFVPIRDGGRYRAEGSATDDPLVVAPGADSSFDVLGPTVNIGANESVVVFNLGQAGSDVYEGSSRRTATSGTTLSNVAFAGGAFPFGSPQYRFHIVSTPVTFECAPDAANPTQGVLRRRWNYGFQPTVAASFAGGSSALMVDGVVACSFAYSPGVLQRNGLVAIRLTLANADGSERIQLMHQVEVLNAP